MAGSFWEVNTCILLLETRPDRPKELDRILNFWREKKKSMLKELEDQSVHQMGPSEQVEFNSHTHIIRSHTHLVRDPDRILPFRNKQCTREYNVGAKSQCMDCSTYPPCLGPIKPISDREEAVQSSLLVDTATCPLTPRAAIVDTFAPGPSLSLTPLSEKITPRCLNFDSPVNPQRNSAVKAAKDQEMRVDNLCPYKHVLVCPRREVKHFVDLTDEETSDLWLTARKVGSQLENYHETSSLTFAIQFLGHCYALLALIDDALLISIFLKTLACDSDLTNAQNCCASDVVCCVMWVLLIRTDSYEFCSPQSLFRGIIYEFLSPKCELNIYFFFRMGHRQDKQYHMCTSISSQGEVRGGDFKKNDEIYDALDVKEIELKKKLDLDMERKDRSLEEMAQEADEYRKLFV
ncbi:HIT-like domain [Dillenia turbinata]|uniref:HIT-like domain n=1 Tax=Dillenia turbinata TaxID=194707 RepID=A0AAN8VHD2_9MAGN